MSTTPIASAHVCTSPHPPDQPSRTGVKDTNAALLELLGLCSLEHIISVDIAMRPSELPRITVQQHCRALQPTAIQFRLLAEPMPPTDSPVRIDLNALCAEARQRLKQSIERNVFFAQLEMLERSVNYDKGARPC